MYLRLSCCLHPQGSFCKQGWHLICMAEYSWNVCQVAGDVGGNALQITLSHTQGVWEQSGSTISESLSKINRRRLQGHTPCEEGISWCCFERGNTSQRTWRWCQGECCQHNGIRDHGYLGRATHRRARASSPSESVSGWGPTSKFAAAARAAAFFQSASSSWGRLTVSVNCPGPAPPFDFVVVYPVAPDFASAFVFVSTRQFSTSNSTSDFLPTTAAALRAQLCCNKDTVPRVFWLCLRRNYSVFCSYLSLFWPYLSIFKAKSFFGHPYLIEYKDIYMLQCPYIRKIKVLI